MLGLVLAYYKCTYANGLPSFVRARVAPSTLEAVVPAVAAGAAVLRLVCPWTKRRFLWQSLRRVVVAPAREVRFVDTYVADVLTSMVKVLQDLLWAACFFASGDFARPASEKRLFTATWAETTSYRRVAAPALCLLPVWFGATRGCFNCTST